VARQIYTLRHLSSQLFDHGCDLRDLVSSEFVFVMLPQHYVGDDTAGFINSALNDTLDPEELLIVNHAFESSESLVVPLATSDSLMLTYMLTIGRSASMDIQLTDPEVSRMHAYLRAREGQWYIEDAGSMNGTYVNVEPLEPITPRLLVSGDEVILPPASLTFLSLPDLTALCALSAQ
jgi:hypothetical protein